VSMRIKGTLSLPCGKRGRKSTSSGSPLIYSSTGEDDGCLLRLKSQINAEESTSSPFLRGGFLRLHAARSRLSTMQSELSDLYRSWQGPE